MIRTFVLISGLLALTAVAAQPDEPTADAALIQNATKSAIAAAQYFHTDVAVHGGYVYKVTLDLKLRKGEGTASPTEVWVQPPGTPTVGIAFLRAFEATGDPGLLVAATDCARALLHGQLKSGGWTDRVDFDPKGKNTGLYRNGQGKAKGRDVSTLDDDKSQAAIRLLIEVDKALEFKDAAIHESVQYALDALLKAQFANGGFPQGWSGPVEPGTVVKASFPEYDWRTEGRIKDYWDYETLNDGLAGTVTETLQLADETYQDDRYRDALLKFGDFLILAQLPEPQPAWAQQYNHQLQPMWARKFEPPAVVGRESEDAIATLMDLTEFSGERRFLEPIPAAIAWLKRSRLPDGQLARFYELKTNTPLYLKRDVYTLTYDDSDLPTHYGFKTDCRVDKLEARYHVLAAGGTPRVSKSNLKTLSKDVTRILSELDPESRWITDQNGDPVVDGANLNPEELFLDSAVFSKNLSRLAEFLKVARTAK